MPWAISSGVPGRPSGTICLIVGIVDASKPPPGIEGLLAACGAKSSAAVAALEAFLASGGDVRTLVEALVMTDAFLYRPLTPPELGGAP